MLCEATLDHFTKELLENVNIDFKWLLQIYIIDYYHYYYNYYYYYYRHHHHHRDFLTCAVRGKYWKTSILGCVQTDATLLANNSQHCCTWHVASVCTPCCMLLDAVACCCAKFETGQTFSPVQTDATLLAYNSQHCWELLRPFARSLKVSIGQVWLIPCLLLL